MKKTNFILPLLFLIGFITSAQNIVDDNTTLIKNYFQQQENNFTPNKSTTSEIENTINSNISVNQIGNYNHANIITSGEKKQALTQVGNQNNYEYNTYFNDVKSTTKITQTGDNNDIQIYGQNNLTKNMEINQKANNQTIIIKNYQ